MTDIFPSKDGSETIVMDEYIDGAVIPPWSPTGHNLARHGWRLDDGEYGRPRWEKFNLRNRLLAVEGDAVWLQDLAICRPPNPATETN